MIYILNVFHNLKLMNCPWINKDYCIVLYCIVRHLRLLVYHIKGKIIVGFVDLWYFVAFKLLIFSSRLCPLLENFSPVVRTFLFSLVFLQLTLRRLLRNGKPLLQKILISNKS